MFSFLDLKKHEQNSASSFRTSKIVKGFVCKRFASLCCGYLGAAPILYTLGTGGHFEPPPFLELCYGTFKCVFAVHCV